MRLSSPARGIDVIVQCNREHCSLYELHFLQQRLSFYHGRFGKIFLYRSCEMSSLMHKQEENMQRLMRNAFGLAVALGTSGLMFAVTLV